MAKRKHIPTEHLSVGFWARFDAKNGVSRQAIDSAILGKTWGWLPPLDIVE